MQALQKAVPQEFELMGQRKGFVRYMSPALRALVKQHADALEMRETALSGILQGLLARFASQAGLWQGAVRAMAELDALMALGYAAQFGGEGAPMCRPTFVEPHPSSQGQTGHVSTPTPALQIASLFNVTARHTKRVCAPILIAERCSMLQESHMAAGDISNLVTVIAKTNLFPKTTTFQNIIIEFQSMSVDPPGWAQGHKPNSVRDTETDAVGATGV